jgi:hypothetical protein
MLPDSFGYFRYNLMANRVLLLLALASRSHPNSSSKILSETAGLYSLLVCFWIFCFLLYFFG